MGGRGEVPMPDAVRSADDEIFRLALDLSPSGMIVVDASGTVLFVNREAEHLFGYDPGELVGRPVESLVPARFHGGHPGLRSNYLAGPQARPMGVGRDLHGLRKD